MTSRRTDCYRVHQVTVTPTATTPVQLTERQRWDYRNRDETWSIFLTRDTVIPHPTADTRFEDFVERLQLAVHTVLAESEHDRLGVVHGVGLRYIDVARASGGKDFRFYLRPGLHGVRDEVFQLGQHLLHTESRGRTVVGGNPGTMVVRIVQNDQASSLPPDFVDAAPSFPPRAEAGELVTLLDMDHFVESRGAAGRGCRASNSQGCKGGKDYPNGLPWVACRPLLRLDLFPPGRQAV